MRHPKILAFILAGGKGERLFPLTVERSKPAVPFGGRYRIVDFVLSNFVNSNIFSIYLLVQYKAQSLIEHIRESWVLSPIMQDHFVTVVPPQMRMGPEWFQGTADAVFQNINLIRYHKPGLIAIFGADHIYRMDIRQMVDFHLNSGASVSVATIPVPIDQASSFGIVNCDKNGRINGFDEKPSKPLPMAGRSGFSLASMGNYIFNTDVLVKGLAKAQQDKEHDFGKHILPGLVDSGKLYAYDFSNNKIPGILSHEEEGYWRDVGTIRAYCESHMDMLGEEPKFDISNALWPIHSAHAKVSAAKIIRGEIINSYIGDGVFIKNARISNSFIRRGVTIEDDVQVEDSIILDNTVLKRGCRIKDTIIDKLNMIEENETIGFDQEKDRFRVHIDSSGTRIMPRGKG
ncbi:MAG: glucose-1-phosphate adenylyltransferase [bacterium]